MSCAHATIAAAYTPSLLPWPACTHPSGHPSTHPSSPAHSPRAYCTVQGSVLARLYQHSLPPHPPAAPPLHRGSNHADCSCPQLPPAAPRSRQKPHPSARVKSGTRPPPGPEPVTQRTAPIRHKPRPLQLAPFLPVLQFLLSQSPSPSTLIATRPPLS